MTKWKNKMEFMLAREVDPTLVVVNPLTPRSDQYINSPNNFNTL